MTTAPATDRMGKRAVIIASGLLAIGVLIALIIAFASGAGDDGADSSTASASRIPQGAARQVSFAEIDGPALPRFEVAAADQAIGMDAPTITASYYDNTETTITPSDGNPRIIMFLAHW